MGSAGVAWQGPAGKAGQGVAGRGLAGKTRRPEQVYKRLTNFQTNKTMKTTKTINANGTMSNLVGLWARIPDENGETKNVVFIYGKADDEFFLVQAISAISGEPNVIRLVRLKEMLDWVFYSCHELLDEERVAEARHGAVRYRG